MILAFETATDVCSIAFENDEGKVFEKRIQGKGVHSDNVFLYTHALMQEHHFKMADLEAVLISNGPGSYTGLRIGASAVKGMLFGLDVDLYTLNTLAGFAQSQIDEVGEGQIHAIIDARRSHLYHQAFKKIDGLMATTDAIIKEISDFENEIQNGDIIVGTGTERITLPAGKTAKVFDSNSISAIHLIRLFNSQPSASFFNKTSLEELNPNYITSNQVNNSTA